MIHFHCITLFPEIFRSFLATSLVGKAVDAGRVNVHYVDPREFTSDRHRTTDDTPYGGGEGMVMKAGPLVEAMDSVAVPVGEPVWRVLLTPQGERLAQHHLTALGQREHVVLVCGRYEGFDERVRSYVHQELSLGDFVLNGGEVAAMAIIDGVARLIPGVLGNPASLCSESHAEGLLEYPQYTRPRSFRGQDVPEVLLNGDHQAIQRWRRSQMLQRTRLRRPDLWAHYPLTAEDRALLEAAPAGTSTARDAGVTTPSRLEALASRTYVALLHHPVYDRGGQIVTTAITNLDLHDIARSARTYGLGGYFVVTPLSSQQELARRIISHWQVGFGASYNQRRAEALALLRVAPDLQAVQKQIEEQTGQPAVIASTSAVARPGQVTPQELLSRLPAGRPLVFVLGTGWGLTEEFLRTADYALAPLRGVQTYNHLAVRSAAAIMLDRFFGLRE